MKLAFALLAMIAFAAAGCRQEPAIDQHASIEQGTATPLDPVSKNDDKSSVSLQNNDELAKNLLGGALEEQLEISLVSHTDNTAVVAVRNTGETVIQYASVGPKLIQKFLETPTGPGWARSDWDWCGTGMSKHNIPPSASVELVVHFRDNERRERIRAYFYEKGTERICFPVLAIEPAN